MEPPVKKVELHIVVGCADARDISSAFNTALAEQIKEESGKGVLIDFQRMSVAGTFMTQEIISEIKYLITEKLREYFAYYQAGAQIEIFVHVMAHGNATLKPGRTHATRSYHDIEIKPAAFNCGMMHAADVAIEMEGVLLKEKAVLEYGLKGKRQQIKIENEESIEKLMLAAYGHNGTIAGNWIKSIVNLTTHAYEQKKILRLALDADPALANLRIHITAGVQNYATNEYYRVDGNMQLNTLMDAVYERIRRMEAVPDQEQRIAKQAPVLGLFHHTSVTHARANAIKYYFGNENYSAGQVFAIGSINVADYFRTFGPYKNAGFFYGVVHLGLKNWVVMGRNVEETSAMMERLKNATLLGYFIRYYQVKLVPMTADGEKLKTA